VAALFGEVHEQEQRIALEAWNEMGEWSVHFDKAAANRRLETLRKPSRPSTSTGRRGSGSGYLRRSRPATAAGRGAAAVNALRRPSTAPARLRQPKTELRVLLRVVLACTRMTLQAESDLEVPFLLTRSVA